MSSVALTAKAVNQLRIVINCLEHFSTFHDQNIVYYNKIFRVSNSICYHLWPMYVRLRNKSGKVVIREQKTY